MSQIHDAAQVAAHGLVLSAHDAARLETMALEAGGDLRQQISAKLDKARFINGNDIADDIATIGSVLCYRIGDGPIQRRTLSLPDVSHPNGQFINLLTPVGLALLGCRAGETVTAPLTDGGALELHLLDVEFQPEAEVRRRSNLRPDDDGDGPSAA